MKQMSFQPNWTNDKVGDDVTLRHLADRFLPTNWEEFANDITVSKPQFSAKVAYDASTFVLFFSNCVSPANSTTKTYRARFFNFSFN